MVLLLGNLKNMISYEILQFFECGPAIGEFKNWTLFGIPLYGPAIREFEKHDFLWFFAIFEYGPANREFKNWTLFSIPL